MHTVLRGGLVAAILTGFAVPTVAADMAGVWQSSLPPSMGGIKVVVQIVHERVGGYSGTMFVADRNPIPIGKVTAVSSTVSWVANIGSYQGVVSADGQRMEGTWIHGNPRPVDAPLALEFVRATRRTKWSLPRDPSPHLSRYVSVGADTNLEVLDWGGTGRPVILLAGLGGTAHAFDTFAPKLAGNYHVYAITRRGFGNSSVPLTGYNADRLGDDVVEVMKGLDLKRPVLVGHSIAGEELSSIGSRFPTRVAGLVYLDSGYSYAYYSKSETDPMARTVDLDELISKLDQLRLENDPTNAAALIRGVLSDDIPNVTRRLQTWQQALQEVSNEPSNSQSNPVVQRLTGPAQDVMTGLKRYTSIPVPALVMMATQHDLTPAQANDAAFRASVPGADAAARGAADAWEKGVPSARVIRLPHATHFVYISNEKEVLDAMKQFIDGLPE